MKTEHLREFVALSETLSFTESAKQLYMAQSTLSTHISQLENELGFSLIDRLERARLTVEGSIFLASAKQALSVLDEGCATCQAVAASKRTRMGISAFDPPASMINSLQERADFPFSFSEHNFNEPFFSMFTDNDVDAAIAIEYRDYKPLWTEAEMLGLIARPLPPGIGHITMMATNPLASLDRLRREDLAGSTIAINDAVNFELVKLRFEKVLGSDLGLTFRLMPIENFMALAYVDYGEGLHLCGVGDSRFLGLRSDIVSFETLDGEPIAIPAVFVERAGASAEQKRRNDIVFSCACEAMAQC